MDNLEAIKGKGAFSVRNWEEIKKGGGKAPSPQEITEYLQGRSGAKLSRDELINRVSQFFSDFTMRCLDEDTGEITYTWKSNPTKSALARYIGVTAETLSRYLRGEHNGMPYGNHPGPNAIVSASDFDVVRNAATIVEEFYESRLGLNANNAGSIFWLKAHDDSRWHDKQELSLSTSASQSIEQLSREEIAARYQSMQEFRELPEKPDLD